MGARHRHAQYGVDVSIPRRTAFRWRVYSAAALALVALLSGCTAASPPVMGADNGRASKLPSQVVYQQGLQPDSVRYLGELNSTKFYAARPVNPGPADVCLVVSESPATAGWAQACAPSSFSLVAGRVTARLFPAGAEKELPSGWQQVGDYLWVQMR
jgi:hypothetical protein